MNQYQWITYIKNNLDMQVIFYDVINSNDDRIYKKIKERINLPSYLYLTDLIKPFYNTNINEPLEINLPLIDKISKNKIIIEI